MKSGKTLWLLFLSFTVIVLGAAPLWAQAVNVEAAKKEGKVVVYGAQVPQAMKPLHTAFKKKYGIDGRILARFVDTGVGTRADRVAGG